MRQAMKTVRSTLDRTCREQAGIWREPTAQATLVLIILIAQVGFWTGFAGDGAFNYRSLQESLSICINTMRFFAPAAAIILMGSAPSRTGTPLTDILARMAVTTLAITTIPLAAFLTLMASIEIVEIFPTGSDIPTGTRIHLGEMLGTHGRTIYGSTTFAALTALLFTATNSKAWTISLLLVWITLENILIDLATGWSPYLSWTLGVAPAHLYHFWTAGEEALWSMKNILGMKDELQGPLILETRTETPILPKSPFS